MQKLIIGGKEYNIVCVCECDFIWWLANDNISYYGIQSIFFSSYVLFFSKTGYPYSIVSTMVARSIHSNQYVW